MNDEYLNCAQEIYEWLSSLHVNDVGYNYGGIYDPLDKRVMGEHYSTTFYALLGALLYKAGSNAELFDKIKQALGFHILTSKDEYLGGDWAYHWDFNNYALISCLRLLKYRLSVSDLNDWKQAARNWKENKHKSVNWILMRAYNAYLRYQECGLLKDKFRFVRYLRYGLNSQLSDGCIEDERGASRPIQYHAYSTALLHKIYLETGKKNVLSAFLRGLEYLISFLDPVGDFNYFGRGQEQIFGYAAAIYVFEAGKIYLVGRIEEFDRLSNRCWTFLNKYKTDEGFFPLVLNNKENNREYGWYDYHHLTVYNSFVGVWLAETWLLRKLRKEKNEPKYRFSSRKKALTFKKASGIITYQSDNYFLCLSTGVKRNKYLTECGLSIQHLFIKRYGALISCPGGPGSQKEKLFAEKYAIFSELVKNFSAPLVKQNGRWKVPSGGIGKLKKMEDSKIGLVYYYPDNILIVEREITFEDNGFLLKDIIRLTSGKDIAKLRIVNLPLIKNKKIKPGKDDLIIIEGDINVRIIVKIDVPCKMKYERLRTAKGDITNYFWEPEERLTEPEKVFYSNISFQIN